MKYRTYPTLRLGICTLVSAAVLFSAVNYQRNALHWLSYAMLVLLCVGTLYSGWKLRHLHWEWIVPQYAFARQPWLLTTSQETNIGYFGEGDIQQSENTIVAPVPGELQLKTTTWSTEFPLGLVHSIYKLPEIPTIWIYPEPINHLRDNPSQADETALDHIKGYQQGDLPKRILKKTQTLPTSQWQVRHASMDLNTSMRVQLFSWNALPSEWTGHQKIEQLSFYIQTMKDNIDFELVLPQHTLPAGSGIEHKHAAWKLLALEWKNWL